MTFESQEIPPTSSGSTTTKTCSTSSGDLADVEKGDYNIRKNYYKASHLGHSLFGCDTRHGAVIVINIINLVLTIILMIVAAVGIAKNNSTSTDANNNNNIVARQAEITSQTAVIAIGVVSLLFYSLGIYGVRRQNLWAVCMTSMWYCATFILNIVSTANIIGIVGDMVFLYPHIALAIELKNSIKYSGAAIFWGGPQAFHLRPH